MDYDTKSLYETSRREGADVHDRRPQCPQRAGTESAVEAAALPGCRTKEVGAAVAAAQLAARPWMAPLARAWSSRGRRKKRVEQARPLASGLVGSFPGDHAQAMGCGGRGALPAKDRREAQTSTARPFLDGHKHAVGANASVFGGPWQGSRRGQHDGRGVQPGECFDSGLVGSERGVWITGGWWVGGVDCWRWRRAG